MFKLSTCLVVIAAIGIIVWRCNLLGAGELARHTELDTDAAKSAVASLFSHIKRNEIVMTAPVQMDYTGNEDDAEIASMAFLYRSTEIGQTGRDSADAVIEVVDLPKQQVVSIGMRGRMTDESVERGHQALLDWLKKRTNKYRPVGPLRRMGYNSPFVPADRAFFELQIPVQPIDDPIAAD